MWPQLLRTIIERNIKLYLIEHSIDTSKTLKTFWAGLWTNAYHHASLITCSDQETFDYFADQEGIEPVIKTDSLRYLSAIKHSEQNWSDKLIEKFCTRRPTLIIASVYIEDIRIIQPIYKELIKCYQLLIVPHHIDADNIDSIRSQFEESMLYSGTEELTNDPILIVDRMGILKYLYRYPSLAYIGGGFGLGIHSAQEAVPYNLPILFGPKHKKFAYAKQLIKEGRAHSVKNADELLTTIQSLDSSQQTDNSTPINRDKLEQDIAYIANAILS
jgi:3-deoxy-D-manno-octulosonic-acid transferase